MAAVEFTDRWIKALKPAKGQSQPVIHSDIVTKGFGIRVSPAGKLTWVWMGRHPVTKKQQLKSIGVYPVMSLADARAEAGRYNEARKAGYDLDEHRAEQATQQQAQAEAEAGEAIKTFEWFWTTLYQPRFVAGKKDEREMTRKFEVQLKPFIGNKLMRDITDDDIQECIDEVLERGAGGSANRLWTFCGTVFGRAKRNFRRELRLATNPAADLPKPFDGEQPRERWLEDDRELVTLFRALSRTTGVNRVHADIIDLIIDTGVRISTARFATWDEFDLDNARWSVPGPRMKNGFPFVCPLASETAMRLRARRALTNGKWVFPGPAFDTLGRALEATDGPMNSVSKCQSALTKETKAIATKDGWTMEHWSAHTLRHTFVSHLRDIAGDGDEPMVQADTIEAAVHHIEGGDRGRYNQFKFLKQKTRINRVWQDKLVALRARADELELEQNSFVGLMAV